MTPGKPLSLAFALLIPLSGMGGDWDTGALVQALGSAPHPPVSYTETRQSAFLDLPLVSHGELQLLPDGTLVKQQQTPYQRVAIGPEKASLATAQGERELPLSALPALRGLGDGLRALLRGDLEILTQLFEPELTGTRTDWSLELTPRDSVVAAAVQAIQVQGTGPHITRLRVLEQDGDSLLLELGKEP